MYWQGFIPWIFSMELSRFQASHRWVWCTDRQGGLSWISAVRLHGRLVGQFRALLRLHSPFHPLIRPHPESGVEAVYGTRGYIIGVKDMDEEEANRLLTDLHNWQTREEFQYSHQWSKNMLVMWDNRSVLHAACGGYEGYDRLLHRTTIAGGKFWLTSGCRMCKRY